MMRLGNFASFFISYVAALYTDNMIYGAAFAFCALTSLWNATRPATPTQEEHAA
jgi:hypothetical protein